MTIKVLVCLVQRPCHSNLLHIIDDFIFLYCSRSFPSGRNWRNVERWFQQRIFQPCITYQDINSAFIDAGNIAIICWLDALSINIFKQERSLVSQKEERKIQLARLFSFGMKSSLNDIFWRLDTLELFSTKLPELLLNNIRYLKMRLPR